MMLTLKGKQIFAIILACLIGLVFIFSAISKLPTLETFGWTIVETTILHWTMAEWFARLLIGLELGIGLLFLLQIQIKKWLVPLSFFILATFTLYLVMVIKQYGSDGNCGCFGEWIPMTPLQSIYKNLILMLMLVMISKLPVLDFKFKFMKFIIPTLIASMILVPFFYHPPESIYITEKEKTLHKPIPLSLLYQSTHNVAPSIELRKGKHIIAFLSLSCRFCRKAAKRLQIMKHKYPELPFYFIINGNPELLPAFYEETGCKSIPQSMFNGAEQFSLLNDGYSLPTIKWVEDTTVIRESNYLSLDEKEILNWLSK